MDLKKLKIEKFNNIKAVNFPVNFDPGIQSTDENTEVILYYIDRVSDIQKFVELCHSVDLPRENRVIMVYRKGRKDEVNRDSIISPFRNEVYKGFKLRAPMLCSISDKLSAFVLSRET